MISSIAAGRRSDRAVPSLVDPSTIPSAMVREQNSLASVKLFPFAQFHEAAECQRVLLPSDGGLLPFLGITQTVMSLQMPYFPVPEINVKKCGVDLGYLGRAIIWGSVADEIPDTRTLASGSPVKRRLSSQVVAATVKCLMSATRICTSWLKLSRSNRRYAERQADDSRQASEISECENWRAVHTIDLPFTIHAAQKVS